MNQIRKLQPMIISLVGVLNIIFKDRICFFIIINYLNLFLYVSMEEFQNFCFLVYL